MKLVLYTLISILLISRTYAQELDLFQDLEVQADKEVKLTRSQQNGGPNPFFSLRGISRFGEKYLISLLANNNDSLLIEWSSNRSSTLIGFPGYSIVDVNSRTATIIYPENSGCTESPAQGVKCNEPYMLLSLTNSKPISQSNGLKMTDSQNLFQEQDEESTVVEGEEGRFYKNPFSGEVEQIPDLSPEEQAIRDERRQRRAELFRDFEVVRIPDEEIPEGMQRIRTPFGDSLEPIGSE
jgi:hypothetical protein